MISSITIDRPTIAITVQDRPPDTLMTGHDLREIGLASATRRLHANRADLDIVYLSRARNDVAKCPVCRVAHDF